MLCGFCIAGALKRKLSKKSGQDVQPDQEQQQQQQEEDEAAKGVKRATTPDPKERVGAPPLPRGPYPVSVTSTPCAWGKAISNFL
jgi:hypothetical protein